MHYGQVLSRIQFQIVKIFFLARARAFFLDQALREERNNLRKTDPTKPGIACLTNEINSRVGESGGNVLQTRIVGQTYF